MYWLVCLLRICACVYVFLIFYRMSSNFILCLHCFFFKQKTAYEIRISDWSSDVCSSDLPGPSWLLYLYFGVGAVLMRAAGCTINDILDRDIDGRVARTATRPIPSGEVSLLQAGVFVATLMLVSLAILLQMNGLTVLLGCASLLLVFPYPLMKRITYWPQAWLGLTFNWGALIGWTAATGFLGWPALLLYLGGIAWTLGYDTIYAHQDKEDDALIGVKSLALRLGDGSKPWLTGFFAVALALFGSAGWAAGLDWPFWLGLAATGPQFAWLVDRKTVGEGTRVSGL